MPVLVVVIAPPRGLCGWSVGRGLVAVRWSNRIDAAAANAQLAWRERGVGVVGVAANGPEFVDGVAAQLACEAAMIG
jgi:hypothetical protein